MAMSNAPSSAEADAMFGKNRMKEVGADVDGDGILEDNELLNLQTLNYCTPGGMRRGEMQVPAGGFSRYTIAMTNKAKGDRVRREMAERMLLGSPHSPNNERVFEVGEDGKLTGEVTTIRSWLGSDLISGRGKLQPLINGSKATRVFVGRKSEDSKLKNHETKDEAQVTTKMCALKKKEDPLSGEANARSPFSGSHTSDEFGDAHCAFTKDEHIDRARNNAQTGHPMPQEADTPEAEARQQDALSWASRSSPNSVLAGNPVLDTLYSFFGIPTSPKTPIASPEEMSARHKASAEKLYPAGYNGAYTAVVQETNAEQAQETRDDIKAWKEEIQIEEHVYLDKATAAHTAVVSGKANGELAKEEMVRARQLEADEMKRESARLHALARDILDKDQKKKAERAAQSFDERYMSIEEMVATLQNFSPDEASLTPRGVYTMDPASRSPREAYLKPFEGQCDQVVKENAALFAKIRGIKQRTDEDISDDAAGAARATMAAQSKARKKAEAKKMAAHVKAAKKGIASAQAQVDADFDMTPLNAND